MSNVRRSLKDVEDRSIFALNRTLSFSYLPQEPGLDEFLEVEVKALEASGASRLGPQTVSLQ